MSNNKKPKEQVNAVMPAVYRSIHSKNISHIGAKQRAKLEARGIRVIELAAPADTEAT